MLQLLKAHIDDSGNSDHGEDGSHFVLAGYVLPVPDWEAFADVWAYQLTQQPTIRCFKMRDAESGDGYFDGISPEFRRCKLLDMARVISHFKPMAVGCHLNWNDYKAVVAGRVHPKLDSPYAILFYQVMRLVHEWQIEYNTRHPGKGYHPVDFVFDDQGKVGIRALQWYEPLKSNMREPYKQMMGGLPEFKDDEVVVPLQAADILAWHVRRKLECPEELRPIFSQIAEHYSELEINLENLSDYVELTKRVDPKELED